MSEKKYQPVPANTSTRRQMIAGAAAGLASLAAGSVVWGKSAQQSMKETPSTGENAKRTAIHVDTDYQASPQRIYEALLDSKQFTAFSGLPAEIDRKEGGTFSMFKGQIVGRNIELVSNQRIVQAWRPAYWDAGFYSIVRFGLKPKDSGATLTLDHWGFPEGDYDSLLSGWHEHYLDALKKYLV